MLSRGLASLRDEGEDFGEVHNLLFLRWTAYTRHLVYWYCGLLLLRFIRSSMGTRFPRLRLLAPPEVCMRP